MKSNPFTAAIVQAAPQYLDLEASVTKAIDLIQQAALSGAKLIAFPELWLPGYPWWIWLGSPAWVAQRGFSAVYRRQAFSYDSVHAQRLRDAARKHRIVVAMGVAEREGASLYIGQWLIDSNGETLFQRRKLKPGATERAAFGEGDGTSLCVSPTDLGRIGALCCGEHRQPLFKYALYAQHEEIHIAAWPSFSVYQPVSPGLGPVVNGALSQAYAAEGGCYVLAPCALVTPDMIELLCDTPERRALLEIGGGYAQAYSPHGEAMCEPMAPDREGLLLVEIDLAQVDAAKASYDAIGHSSRPDIVGLQRHDAGKPNEPVRPDCDARSPAASEGRDLGKTPGLAG